MYLLKTKPESKASLFFMFRFHIRKTLKKSFLFLVFMHLLNFLINLTRWESWHYHIKYIPIAPVWLWYCIKARSLWFFTASNPTITFGGFEGEGKFEIYQQLPTGSYPESLYIMPGTSIEKLQQIITENNFNYPFIVKPDVGLMGYMFRKISSFDQLQLYHENMPLPYLVQKWVGLPVEVSVFYYRMPWAAKGSVSGFLMKQSPEVTGDGISTLEQLIENNQDLKFRKEQLKLRHKGLLKKVIQKSQKVILSHACNRSQGGKLVSLSHEIDENLRRVFDGISHASKHFYYGRYDIKCESIEKLKKGTDFLILEYNGAGAGVQHVYGNGLSLWQACTTIAKHWKMLYKISKYNHTVNGIPYYENRKGKEFLKFARENIRLLKKIDTDFPVF